MTQSRFALATALFALGMSSHALAAGQQKVYIVQLADAPVATFTGGVAGLAATRPAAGAKLDAAAPHVRAYAAFLASRRSAELAKAGLPNQVIHHYSYTYSGFSMLLTPAQAKSLKQSAGVRSVVESTLVTVDTTRTPGFLGLTNPGGLWSQLDGLARKVKGEDIIIGVIDTGIWPENPSFGDKVDSAGHPVAYNAAGTSAYGPPPVKWKGTCVTGEGFTAAMCNNKLIGARYYGDAFIAGAAASGSYTLHPRLEYISPRDGAGHGSHTASTSGGNEGVNATVNGTAIGNINGIAPRARLAAYKALWTASTTPTNDGGATADILKAIDDAVSDGVDVINYSVSGSQTNVVDPVEIAYLNASAAGVFVAASAGNGNTETPVKKVAHNSPWLITVAASTHDRQALGDFTTGDGVAHRNGASVFGGTVTASTVLAKDIAASGAAVADAQRCFAGTLDSARAAGKIVVCDRGVSARVDKSAEVKRAGGAGMVLVNVSAAANGLVADFHSVPAVHLPLAERASIYAYVTAAGAGATGTISPPSAPPAIVAPVMVDFSSRGPNKASPDIMKPDITGPGVDVLAAYIDDSQSQAQHDAVIMGTYTPQANANSLSGTSMSSPHIAGAAALLRQLHPNWTSAAIKSALMTTTTGVKLADGSPDPDRWGYGAGHMNPNAAGTPSLVYDLSTADYGRYLCGLGFAPPAGVGNCASLGSVAAYNLNLASISAANVPGALTMTRKVTNVSGATATFVASTSLPGWTTSVSPPSLTLADGASGNFSVTVTRNGAALNTWSFGSLTWSDGVHNVVSPLNARAVGFQAPAQVSDTRVSGTGTKVIPVVSAYTGSLTVAPVGLVPATRTTGNVATGQVQCLDFSVGAGAQLARFQLFATETTAADLDLEVFNGSGGTGASVGSSGGSTSDEVVTLAAPAAGTYSACVTGYSAGSGSAFTLSSWVVGPAVGTQTLRASAPTTVYTGGSASVAVGWNVPAGKRYLGNLSYIDNTGSVIGSTIVFVDNH